MVDGAISSNQIKITDHIVNYYKSMLSEQFTWRLSLDRLHIDALESQKAEQLKRK